MIKKGKTVNFRDYFPWWSKIIIKIILSRLPISNGIWQKLNIFRHSSGVGPEYIYTAFKELLDVSNIRYKNKSFTILEIGPGESIASGIIAHCFGAEKSYLVDINTDATEDIKYYRKLVNYIKNYHDNVLDINHIQKLTELLELYNIEYLTNGIESLKELPRYSIDYIWSQSVLEHIRKDEFNDLIVETRRVLKADGVCVHKIDLKDHLDYAHNNLRFSEKIWESEFMVNSGFYTNRMLYSQMLEIFKQKGFKVDVVNIEKWNELPTRREKLNSNFRNMSIEELQISAFDVVLHPI